MKCMGIGTRRRDGKLGGGIFYTYNTKDTCNPLCPLQDKCYGKFGPVAFQFEDTYSPDTLSMFNKFMDTLPEGAIVRHHITGDFGLNGKLNYEYITDFILSHLSRPDITAWVYTHFWREFGKNPFRNIGNINAIASCETLADVEAAKKLGWNTALVVSSTACPSTMPEGVKICPHAVSKGAVTCTTCKVCVDRAMPTIAFPAHGAKKNKIKTEI